MPGKGFLERRRMCKNYGMDTKLMKVISYNSSKFVAEPEPLITPTESDVESDEAVWKLFDRWCLKYRNMTKEDMLERFSIFKNKAIELAKYNKNHPTCTWSLSGTAYKTMEELDRGHGSSKNVSRRRSSLQPIASDVESDKAVWKLYRKWCHKYKEKRSKEEMQKRFSIFKNNAIQLVELNKNRCSRRILLLTADTIPKPILPPTDEAESDVKSNVPAYMYNRPLRVEELQKRFPRLTRMARKVA